MTEIRRRVSDRAAEKLSAWTAKLHLPGHGGGGGRPSSSGGREEDDNDEQPAKRPRRVVWPPEEWFISGHTAPPSPQPQPPPSPSALPPPLPARSYAPAPRFDDEPPNLRKLMVSDEDAPLTLAGSRSPARSPSPPHQLVDEPDEMSTDVPIVNEPEEMTDEPAQLVEEPDEMVDTNHLASTSHFLPTPATASPGSTGSPHLVASPGGMDSPPTPPTTRSTTAQTSMDDTVAAYPFPRPPRHPSTRTGGSHVKETFGARASTHADGTRMLNQYILLETLGRGSFGLVQAAIDAESGQEYAIKELSRARLRRKAQREAHRRAREIREGIASSEGRAPDPNPEDVGHEQTATQIDALYLIRNEIAIMKKVNHPNVVRLFEVLDAPSEDTLYMVLEICRGGPIMSVSLDKHRPSKALPLKVAHDYFRQMVSGVSYLHANDIVHHDIKPDNVLTTADRKTVKLVDFGVSAVFEKPGDDSFRDGTPAAGVASPAFAAPEQFGSDHTPTGRGVHGTAADIWSLGVTLMCMVTGRLPFEEESMLEMYDAIANREPTVPSDLPAELIDLVRQLLTKDPLKRIKMPQLREHPWITDNGKRPLPSMVKDSTPITPVTQADLDDALLVGLHSLRQAFHDAVAAARQASREHARLKGSDRLGDGKRRAFFSALKTELAARGAVSRAEFERSWLEWRTGSSSGNVSQLGGVAGKISPTRSKRLGSKS